MKSQNEIQNTQNERLMLDCQYSARVLFNKAEKLGYHTLVCSLCSALCIFLAGETISIIVPFLFDLLTVLFGYTTKKAQAKAALIRSLFDAKVLGIKENSFSAEELRSIYDVVDTIVQKNPNAHNSQIKNSGRDYPPGVKNWYEFAREYPGNEAVFECQKQNCWWNNKLCKQRIIITLIFFVFFFGMLFFCTRIFQINMIQVVFCILGLIIGFVGQIIENFKYISISKTIDDHIRKLDMIINGF